MVNDEEGNIKVLVIDDEQIVLDLVRYALERAGFQVFSAADGKSGLEIFKNEDPFLILTDIQMPGMSGFEVLKTVKTECPTTQVVVFSGVGTTDNVIEALRLGACDYLYKPFEIPLLLHTVSRCIERHELIRERMDRNLSLEKEVVKRTAALTNIFHATIKSLGRITEMRDPYTSGHQNRVSALAVAIGKELGMSQRELEVIQVAGLLHDIGKVAVPVELLVKPSQLTLTEFQLIKIHPQAGYDVIKEIPFVDSLGKDVAVIVWQHHERENGSGYPKGLTDDGLEPESKILSVADVVEAMSSHRPYRPSLDMALAKREISEKKKELYASECVDACIHLIEKNDNDSNRLFGGLRRW